MVLTRRAEKTFCLWLNFLLIRFLFYHLRFFFLISYLRSTYNQSWKLSELHPLLLYSMLVISLFSHCWPLLGEEWGLGPWNIVEWKSHFSLLVRLFSYFGNFFRFYSFLSKSFNFSQFQRPNYGCLDGIEVCHFKRSDLELGI